MDIEQIKNELLKDEEFMEKLFKYIEKRRHEKFSNVIRKNKTPLVKKATNDEFIERVRKIATSPLRNIIVFS